MKKEKRMKTLELKITDFIPKNYTGIVKWEDGLTAWYKEGLLHRTDGPAYIRFDDPSWYLDGDYLFFSYLETLIRKSIFLGAEKGKYDLYWLRFFTEDKIKEFPIIPGMKEFYHYNKMFSLLRKLHGYEV